MQQKRRWRRWLGVAIAIVGGLMAVGGVLAAAVVSDGGNFEVDLADYTFNGDGTSTWTYTVRLLTSLDKALSHQSIGIDPDCEIVDPDDGGVYNTSGFSFDVTFGIEQNSGTEAIKFETVGEGPKQAGDVLTFTLTIEGAKLGQVVSGTLFTMKYGTVFDTASVDGPLCEPTAVQLTGVRSQGGAQSLAFIGLALAGIVVSGAAVWELHKPRL